MRVQRGLLPDRLIKTEGIDIAARYEAASDALEVGGDWYDTISLGEGLFGVVVGDIVGHGIEAMTSMGRLRTALAALATHYDDPAELFSAVDEFVYTADDRQRYATVFYAIVDVDGPSIRYASAGHPPGLLVSPDGTCNWLDQGQSEPLVGHSVANRQSAEIAVDRGALLVLYSDGLIERRGESIATGLARLEAAAASFADGSAAEICELLIGELSLDQREDDAVVVAIKLETTPSEEFHETFPAEPEQLRQVRSSLGSWMETCDIPASVRNDLLISVGEATANVVRHAYHDVPALDMEVRVTRFDHVLGVQVADRGSWRFDADDDSHGMGTDIMRTITEGFQIDRTPSGTLVSFRVPIEGRRRGATGPGTDNGSDRPEHHGSARED
jgi:anti-sigma regulatory factor (Ser/Thr protein kinase)